MPGSDTPHLPQTVTNPTHSGWNQLRVAVSRPILCRVVFSRFGDGTTKCGAFEAEGELPFLMIVLAVPRNGVSLS
jgi:hypothetical protein